MALDDRTELLGTFLEALPWEMQQQEPKVERWTRYHDLYGGAPREAQKNTPWEGASNVVVNLTRIYVDQLHARIMQSLFAHRPHWSAEQLARTNAAAARPTERYLDWGSEVIGTHRRTMKRATLEGIKLGTMILRASWKDEPLDDPAAGDSGAEATPTPPRADGRRLIGPLAEWVPREDFLIPQGYSDIARAPWIAHRSWYSWQDLQTLDAMGDITEGALDHLRGHADEVPRIKEQRAASYGEDAQPSTAEPFGLYGIWQVWFQWQMETDRRPAEYVMMLHPGTRLLVKDPARAPYPRGARPYVATPFIEVEGEFDGLGIPAAVEHYQEAVSTINNQMLDNATIVNAPIFVVEQGSGMVRQYKFKPGGFIPAISVNSIKPLMVNPGYQRAIGDQQWLVNLAERAVGLSDPSLGQMSSPLGRAAASTVLAVMQEGTRRHDFQTEEMRSADSALGEWFVELYQTHGLPAPDQPCAPEVILGPEDGAAVRAVLGVQDYIPGAVGLKVNAATAALNREMAKQADMQLAQVIQGYMAQQKQTLMDLMQVMQQPGAPPQILEMIARAALGADTMMKRLFQNFGAFDLEQVLVGDVLAQLAASPPPPPPPQAAPPAPGGMPPTNGQAGPPMPMPPPGMGMPGA